MGSGFGTGVCGLDFRVERIWVSGLGSGVLTHKNKFGSGIVGFVFPARRFDCVLVRSSVRPSLPS